MRIQEALWAGIKNMLMELQGPGQPDPTQPAQGMPMGSDQSQQEAPPVDGVDDEDGEDDIQAMDPRIFSAIKGMPFVVDYDHRNSKCSPEKLASKEPSELETLKLNVTKKMQSIELSVGAGLYSRPDYKYFQSMKSFIDALMRLKKEN